MLVKLLSIFLFLVLLDLNLVVSSISDDQFTFNGFSGANLTVDGVAMVMPSGLLMLTNGTNQVKGHAFYPAPLHLRPSSNGTIQSFSTTFVFAIISKYVNLSDHGMAFFISASKNLSTRLAGKDLGLVNTEDSSNVTNHLFAVEFDTVLNPELHDIDGNHVGIDVNSVISLKSTTAGYYDDQTGKFQNFSLCSRKAMQVWVDYDGHTMELNVTMAPLRVSKPKRPLLSSTVNLSMVVMDEAYIGFSATTSNLFPRHYVLGWSFKLNGVAPPLDASKLPVLPRVGPKPPSKVLEIVLPIATGAFVITLITAIFLFLWRRLMYAELHEDWEVEFGPHRFSYKDLFHATNGFKEKHLLGIGGFGRVYKGVLQTSKMEIAVKTVSHESRQGVKEFVAEVVSIGRLRHRNIVRLLGYCRRKGELLLVYEYMPNGSLDKYLYDPNKTALDWAQRCRIIKGVASGLLYLHEDWEQVVIHRDIKASNVLLDGEMNARLGDFGLSRLYDHGVDPSTTHVVGTMGYLAPELVRTGRATPITDVFAFGVFILEVTCGQRPLQRGAPDDQFVLVDWVLEHLCKGSITDTVDLRLGGEYVVDEARMLLKLGLLCAHALPAARPSMHQVMQYLDGDSPLPELSPTYLSFSTQAMMQHEGFDSHVVTSFGTMSGLSGGR